MLVAVDVDQWQEDAETWEFPLVASEEEVPERDVGTQIRVSELHESVANEFASKDWLVRLRRDIERRQQQPMSRALAIKVNDELLTAAPAELLLSDSIRPAHKTFTFNGFGRIPVEVKAYCGLMRGAPQTLGGTCTATTALFLEPTKTRRQAGV